MSASVIRAAAGPSHRAWGLAGDAGMLLVVPHLLKGHVPDRVAERGLSKARAPRGAMTNIESNVDIIVAISYSSPQLDLRVRVGGRVLAFTLRHMDGRVQDSSLKMR